MCNVMWLKFIELVAHGRHRVQKVSRICNYVYYRSFCSNRAQHGVITFLHYAKLCKVYTFSMPLSTQWDVVEHLHN